MSCGDCGVGAFLVCWCRAGLFGGWVVFETFAKDRPPRAASMISSILLRKMILRVYALRPTSDQSEVSPKDFVFLHEHSQTDDGPHFVK